MNGIILSCEVETIQTRRDRTIKIVLGTQELSHDNAAELLDMVNKIAAVHISPKETISQDEIDMVDDLDPEFERKSQSQRIRNVLYKLYEQDGEGFRDFNDFYHSHTEKIIEQLKKRIK